ncbi:hypothetical protein A0128_05765 [Leptospira tipperaryensis]|uniref:Uncharacterized protein n=1 Tax=Leptospira tipperaryensis TaxID=2564040 RepID=A0A1D7UV25_9LEPT|nr:hypothetical protein A0128_05765 [Leptospira tipperaryensis]
MFFRINLIPKIKKESRSFVCSNYDKRTLIFFYLKSDFKSASKMLGKIRLHYKASLTGKSIRTGE